ncbi:DELLA protein RGL3 [Linum perenne]
MPVENQEQNLYSSSSHTSPGSHNNQQEMKMFSMEELGQVYPLNHNPNNLTNNDKGLQLFNDVRDRPSQMQPPQSESSSNNNKGITLDDYVVACFPAPAALQPMHEVKRQENISNKHNSSSSISSSLELLNSYGTGFRKLNNNNNINNQSSSAVTWTTRNKAAGENKCTRKLSTEGVMRVAGERYIKFSDQQRCDDFSMLMHPFGYALSEGLSEEETKDVELAHLLLAAAEKVGFNQYDRASRLLTRCEWIASDRSNASQRVVHCFAEALRERIDRGLGKFILSMPEPYPSYNSIYNGLGTNLASICLHQKAPFSQVMQMTTVQAIVENIGTSTRKLHCIDLEIRSGVIWTSLMEALANRGAGCVMIEHLRVTAIARISDRYSVEDTGKRLESFARSMNFPFSFHIVYVNTCLSDIREDVFRVAFDETVVVLCTFILRTLLGRPERLENLNPTLMVVGETEANHNSPVFVSRFIEALFYYSAYFDSLETCMHEDIEYRSVIEATLAQGLRNMVAMEGNERTSRNVKLEVWRSFFSSRFKMVELGFSETSIYQASLVVKQFQEWGSCSIEKDGEGLTIGWKGTPLFSLSAWKFSRDRLGRFFNYRFF